MNNCMGKFIYQLVFIVALIIVFIGLNNLLENPLGFIFSQFGVGPQVEVSDAIKDALVEIISPKSAPPLNLGSREGHGSRQAPTFEGEPCVYRAIPGPTGDIDIFDEIPQSWLDKTRFDREIDEPQPNEDYFLLLDPEPGYGDDEFWLFVVHFKAVSPRIMLERGWVRVTNLEAITSECGLSDLSDAATPETPVSKAKDDFQGIEGEGEPCVYRAIPGITGDIDIFDEVPQGLLDKMRFDREIDEPQPNEDYFLLLEPTPGYGDDEYWLYVSHFKANYPNTMLDKGWVRATNLEATTNACKLPTLR